MTQENVVGYLLFLASFCFGLAIAGGVIHLLGRVYRRCRVYFEPTDRTAQSQRMADDEQERRRRLHLRSVAEFEGTTRRHGLTSDERWSPDGQRVEAPEASSTRCHATAMFPPGSSARRWSVVGRQVH